LLFANVGEIRFATLGGDLDEAVRASERLVARSDELGLPVRGRGGAIAANYALVCLGRGVETLDRMSTARIAEGETDALERSGMASLLAQVGHLAEARELLGQLQEELEPAIQEGEIPTRIVIEMLQASMLLGERNAIGVLAHALDGTRSMSMTPFTFACPARLLGSASALLGKPDEARAFYDQALEVCAKIRFRPEIALTRLQLAELLLAESAKPNPIDLRTSPSQPNNDVGARSPRPGGVGEGASEGEETSPLRGVALAAALRTEALEHLDFAIKEFREMKMQPSLERALRHRGLLKA